MTPEQLAAIKARVERPMEDTWPLRADIRALVAEVERLTAENERLENWRDESGASFMDLREALKKAGTDPYRTAHGGTDRVRVAIACVARLAAEVERLQRIEAERDDALALARTVEWLPPSYGDAITVADARAYLLAKGWRHEFDVRYRPLEPIMCNGYRRNRKVGALETVDAVRAPAVEGLADHGYAMTRILQVCAIAEGRTTFDVWREMRGFAALRAAGSGE